MSIKSEPTLQTVIDLLRENIFSSLNCHAIGVIKSFDASTQRAYVEVAYSRKVENKADAQERIDYPALVDVPVICLGGGQGSIRFPISEGDNCILLFNDRDIDNFLESDSFNQLASDRKHSFSDAIALVGIRNKANKLTDYTSDRTELVHDSAKISMKQKIRIKNASSDLHTVLSDIMTILTTISNAVAVAPGNPSFPGLLASVTAAQAKLNNLLES